jgi:hypothetical protein
VNYCERNARALLKTMRTFKDYEHIALRTVKDPEHNDRRTVMNYVSTSSLLHCSMLIALCTSNDLLDIKCEFNLYNNI